MKASLPLVYPNNAGRYRFGHVISNDDVKQKKNLDIFGVFCIIPFHAIEKKYLLFTVYYR